MVDENNVGASASAQAPGALCGDHPRRPAVGTCARCGNFYCGACAGRREGAQGFCRRCDEGRAYVPFEDPELGFWTGYGRTLSSSLVALPRFAAELPRSGGWARPFVFAVLPTLAALLLGMASIALVVALFGADVLPTAPPDIGLRVLVAILLYTVSGIGGYLLYLVAWPAVLMISARMFGNQRLQYEGLYRILCYASGWDPLESTCRHASLSIL